MSTKYRPGEVRTMVEVGSEVGFGSQRMERRMEMSAMFLSQGANACGLFGKNTAVGEGCDFEIGMSWG